jgi:hypothetical protein
MSRWVNRTRNRPCAVNVPVPVRNSRCCGEQGFGKMEEPARALLLSRYPSPAQCAIDDGDSGLFRVCGDLSNHPQPTAILPQAVSSRQRGADPDRERTMRCAHPGVVLGLHRSRYERRLLESALGLGIRAIDTSALGRRPLICHRRPSADLLARRGRQRAAITTRPCQTSSSPRMSRASFSLPAATNVSPTTPPSVITARNGFKRLPEVDSLILRTAIRTGATDCWWDGSVVLDCLLQASRRHPGARRGALARGDHEKGA